MKLKIRTKLFVSFGLILFLMLGSSLMAMNLLDKMAQLDLQADRAADQVIFFKEVEGQHYLFVGNLANALMMGQAFDGQLDHQQCALGRWYFEYIKSDAFTQLPTSTQKLLLDMDKPHHTLHQSAVKIVEIMKSPDPRTGEINMAAAMNIFQQETLPNTLIMQNYFKDLNQLFLNDKDHNTSQALEFEQYSNRITMIILIVALILGIVIALTLNRSITVPINAIVDRLKEMADRGGDLTQRVEVKTNDELADLAQSFNRFIDKLRDMLIQVRNAADTVTTAATQISAGNQDLAQRTEEQASSLQEVSSTVEEVTASLQQSADNANEADRISRATHEKVKEGEIVVGNMHQAMNSITTSSEEIAEIISKVNDIAFQTNLLALNAAVEAARAGEQGRGFAVVAAEVRNLAGRAAESAKEIEKLIKGSIQNVSQGNELMSRTSTVLNEIIQNTERTVDVIGEIAASMREQSTASSEIRTAVEELNQVTQQNASMVEEIASSSESMQGESSELIDLVTTFKLDEDRPGSKKQKRVEKKSMQPTAPKFITKKEKKGSRDSDDMDLFDDLKDSDFEKF